jgi:hypothetical protein
MLNLSYDLFDVRISSEKLFTTKNVNWDLNNRINKNVLDYDLSINDLFFFFFFFKSFIILNIL